MNNRGEHKIFLLLLVVLAAVSILFYYTAKKRIAREAPKVVSIEKPANHKKKAEWKDDERAEVSIGAGKIIAEVAASDAKKHAGLSGREKFAEGTTSMLFVFDSPGPYSFWNKDMLFPINIIWIKDNTVVDSSENMPDFKTSPGYTVAPRVEANFVLEVAAGFVKEHNIKAGDSVSITKEK